MDLGSGWVWKRGLNVFQSEQPGTTRIRVLAHRSRDRIYITTSEVNVGPLWGGGVEFWAYTTSFSGTRMVSVLYRDESTGHRFANVNHLVGWKTVFLIWLPV